MVRSDRTYRFGVPAGDLWSAIERTDDYIKWWSWLRDFEGDGFFEGAVWQCTVQPPLPWLLNFSITLDSVTRGARADATVRGDIEGTATLTVDQSGAGSTARLVSDLKPASPLLQAVALAARPLVIWGHDWVLDQGASQFTRRGLPAVGHH